jgi:hypothetical protein
METTKMGKSKKARKAAQATVGESMALTVIDQTGAIVEPTVLDGTADTTADDSIDAYLASLPFIPIPQRKADIGSNDVDCLRGVKPSKWCLVGRTERVSMRDTAKRCFPEMVAEAAVDRWLIETGNDPLTRLTRAGYVLGVDFWMVDSLRAVASDAVVARYVLGVRRAPLLAPRTVTEPVSS